MSSDYVTLVGAEDVQRAGNTISSAADQMQSAANTISESNHQHQQYMEQWIERFEAAVHKMVKGNQHG